MSGGIIHGGYVLLSRKLLKSGIMEKPHLYLKLWVWMLLQASHQEHGGLKRGQFFTSIEKMRNAMSYKVGNRVEFPTRKQTRCVYAFFLRTDTIEVLKVTHGLLITIRKYDYYQDPSNYEGHKENPESPSKGTPKGTPKGTENGGLTSGDYSCFPQDGDSEGHTEGQPENPSKGTILTRRDNKKGYTPADFSALKKRYPNQGLIDEAFAAIRSTRKSGKVADSVLLNQLRKWDKYPPEQVEAGIRIYLQKGYADQGKREEYLLGIIRNENNVRLVAPQPESTGSRLLDSYYEQNGN